MKTKCITNEAFEDQLTTLKEYEVLATQHNSVYIRNDKGECKWYGMNRFDFVLQDQAV